MEESQVTEALAAELDVNRPHTARMYDYYPGPRPTPAEVSVYGGVARKPGYGG